ncbi:MAG: LytR family transcriptional regulator, partial [Actinomycetota bacterium]|nr:LytR family transcriptional regulator [Actinomycetota bacterium]
RHGVGDGSDLGRISSQQVFLSALARKIESEGVLRNPLQLYGLATAAAQNMQLSDTLARLDTMVSIALALKSVPLQNIVMIQYPAGSSPLYPDRVVPVAADAAVNSALVKDLAVSLTGTTGRGAIVSTTPTTAATPTQTPTPTGGKTTSSKQKGSVTPSPTPTPTATPPAPVVLTALPSTVTGQTADEQTCAKGTGK